VNLKTFSEFFERVQTYAVIRQKGKPADIEKPRFRLVRDAVSILALSQLGYRLRRFTASLAYWMYIDPQALHLFS